MLPFQSLDSTETELGPMAIYGYARVSSADQDDALQEHALRAAGCEVIRAEKASGNQSAVRQPA